MNWMTSGRKRVQRSQKIKELRAKHFAKVAADRARALPHPSRSSSTSSTNGTPGPRQSTDVSRLKSRWMQATQPGLPAHGHTIAATVQRPQSDPTSTKPAEAMSSPTSPLNDLGDGPREGPFRPGMLNLDVTPPLGAIPRVYRDRIASVENPNSMASDTGEGSGIFAGSFDQGQQPAPPLRSGATPMCPPETPYLERRQLVFGGACEEGRDSGEDYEGQPLGSEGEPQGNPMRFFNSGVEIAHDGSPVSGILAASSQPVGNALARLPSPGDPDLRASDVGAIGVKESSGGRGLPRFSKGGIFGASQSQPVATPSRSSMSWERASLQGSRSEDFLSSVADLEPGVAIDLAGEAYAHEDEHRYGCWSFAEEAKEEAESVKSQGCAGDGLEHEPGNEALTPPGGQNSMPAKFEALARTWGLFSGALNSTPGSTNDNNNNNAASSSNKKPSTAYHAEPLGARNDEGHWEGRDASSGICTPKRVCESVTDGTDVTQVESPHTFDSPPRSHEPGGSRPQDDEDDCSRSPELVMLWDVGGPPDEDQAREAAPADQEQELKGNRQLCGPRSTSPSSPSPVVNLALKSDSSQEEQAPQEEQPPQEEQAPQEGHASQEEQAPQQGQGPEEGQVEANVLQQTASPQNLPAAAVKGKQRVDEQTSVHGGALSLSASKLTQKPIEGDGTESTRRAAGDGRKREAQQTQAKGGNMSLLEAHQPQAKVGNLALSPGSALGPSRGGRVDKGLEGVGGKTVPSSEGQVSAGGVERAIVAKELVCDAFPTVSVRTSSNIECRALPEISSPDAAEEHETPRDTSTPEPDVVEIIDKPRQPPHLSSLDESTLQSETRKRRRETVHVKSEQECDHEREKSKAESARVTGWNGKCRRGEPLAASRHKGDGGGGWAVTSRGRTMVSMRGPDDAVEMEDAPNIDGRSTATWYRTIVACLTAESRG